MASMAEVTPLTNHMDVSKNRGTPNPQNGWFIMVPNPIKIDDLGVPLFLETPTYPSK